MTRSFRWLAALAITVLLLAQFAWVSPTNFGGFDEWLILSLVERGIIDVAYANRPFELLFSLPARYGPPSLWTYYAFHVAYLAGAAWLSFLLVRRLSPHRPLLALLTGIFAAVWTPADYQRLNVVQPYAGYVFVTMLAILLLVEGWLRSRPVLLWLGALVAFCDIRAYEATGALLLGAPLLLPWAKSRPRRAWAWILAWEAVVLCALLLAALGLLFPGRQQAYQQQLLGGLDPNPLRVLQRFAEQYHYHLFPLLTTPLSELRVAAVPLALLLFGVLFALLARATGREECASTDSARAELPRLLALGVTLAGLGYAVLVLSGGLFQAARTQFLSAPGIALFLASTIALATSLVQPRWRLLLMGLLAGWVVAVGTARTLALQRFWDHVSVHDDQVRMLRNLIRTAPAFAPNTYVVLIDQASTFETTIAFRHALLYLYGGEATGYAWGKWDFLYPARLTPGGLLSEPAPVIRSAWQAPVTFHRFDELVVVHQPKAGPPRILDEWPAQWLAPLPAGARYAPRARVREAPPRPQWRILGAASLP